ncbi:hypothetical protein HCN44_000558 [Aphidius gifuensis]|uniref:CBF1-interacting co-repressor CIR N-terminal domain-containing protein n=1 Tax=Aphidius gifuensis TaxID=684658 RepID=A0A835CR06_APHGI|nr:leukocyte receptor cluster member 1 homolog [Aphidius gifuensis]KAF7990753.1 hypothetical protein HCN44_000558 [Aphidius gifuensis]
MNILPKKRWHVRTRDNIARVRRDEAQAAEEEKAKKSRIQKAETEARIDILRSKARQKYDGRNEQQEEDIKKPEKLEHVNFFRDLEQGIVDYNKPNAEHEAEKKAEKEKYEKQIGYLTYLGQDTNESTGKKNWYDQIPARLIDKEKKTEIYSKNKTIEDPMSVIKKYIKTTSSSTSVSSPNKDIIKIENTKKRKRQSDSDNDNDNDDDKNKRKKHKKNKKKKSKKHKSDKYDDDNDDKKPSKLSIEKLRQARLLREQSEKTKTEQLLAKLRGDPLPIVIKEEPKPTIRQKYNSQYCPEIARQNAERTPRH